MPPINSTSVSGSQNFNPSSAISRTPLEILEKIIEPLDQKDILKVRGVSRKMNDIFSPFITSIKAKNLNFTNSISDSIFFRNKKEETLNSFNDRLDFLKKTRMEATLHLDSCRCTDSTFAALPKDIRHLKISNTFFKASNLKPEQRFDNLESLTLEGSINYDSKNLFSIPAMPDKATAALLQKAPNLEYLTLGDGSNLSDQDIQSLPIFPQLKHLDLESSRLSRNAVLALLQKAPNLERLTLRGDIDQDIQSLPVLAKLKDLSIINKNSTESYFAPSELLQKTPNLDRLILRECSKLSVQDIQSLPVFPQLKYLDLESSELSRDAIPALLQKVPNLEHLIFMNGVHFSYQNIQSLPILAQLKDLNIHKSNARSCVALLQKTPNLEHLTLMECSKLSIQDIQSLPVFPQLKYLDLKSSKLSREAVLALLQKAPNLEHLVLMDKEALDIPEVQSLCALTKLGYLSINGVSVAIPALRQHALHYDSDAPIDPNQA